MSGNLEHLAELYLEQCIKQLPLDKKTRDEFKACLYEDESSCGQCFETFVNLTATLYEHSKCFKLRMQIM